MRLDMTMDEFNSKGGQEWFKGELSITLGISKEVVNIIGVYEGSVIVVYEILDNDANEKSINQILETISNSVDFGGFSVLSTSSEAFVPPVVVIEVIQESNNLGLILGILSLAIVIVGVSGILIYKKK